MHKRLVGLLVQGRSIECLAAFAVMLLGACAGTGGMRESEALGNELARYPVVLLGEAHDNPPHHRLRLESLRFALASDTRYRPALLMEQFDRERQADIERARRERPRDAAYLIAQASPQSTRPGGSGWNWTFYQPFVQLALDHDLPLVAANASRADLFRESKEGFGALFNPAELARLGLDQPVPADIQSTQERAIACGHCNALPPAALAPMARAQTARDAFMALKIAEHAPRAAVLLAGNGHVRRDIGAPRWLLAQAQSFVMTYLEASANAEQRAASDQVVVTSAAAREDPCAVLLNNRPAPRTQ